MKIAMLAPIAWRTPPEHYGPWELVTSLLTEQLVKQGMDVTLFATANSITSARLQAVCPQGYEENKDMDAKVWECLHISACFDRASEFDIIHNQFDFLPLSYSSLVQTPVVTTIHGFSSPRILPVYKKYNQRSHYVSISYADRSPELDYIANVYHGIHLDHFEFNEKPEGDYLLFFGRIHQDKGAREAIEIAAASGRKLLMAGIIQDQRYFEQFVQPHLQTGLVEFIGSVLPAARNQLLRNATALLHPIHFNEPFGLSVVEAMACGTPVLAFNKGSMPELIKDGVNGYLVRNVAEAVNVLDAIEQIDRSACRESVIHRFSDERMAADYIQVYQRIYDKYKIIKR